jgi:hypothetical protein
MFGRKKGPSVSLIEKPFIPPVRAKKVPITQVIVHYDCGIGNNLFIRGEGASLSWEKGVKLRNLKSNEWLWQYDETFQECQFKIVLNDERYETGENHHVTCGKVITVEPQF